MTESSIHESYSFVCLDCGYGWERTFEIRRAADAAGGTRVEYYVTGLREPSPLTHGLCPECGGHHVRTLRPGRTASAHVGARSR